MKGHAEEREGRLWDNLMPASKISCSWHIKNSGEKYISNAYTEVHFEIHKKNKIKLSPSIIA